MWIWTALDPFLPSDTKITIIVQEKSILVVIKMLKDRTFQNHTEIWSFFDQIVFTDFREKK